MSQVSLRLPDVVHKVDRVQAIKNGVVVLKVVDRMVIDFGLVATHLPAGLIAIFRLWLDYPCAFPRPEQQSCVDVEQSRKMWD
jgi:hypothetical protein